MTNTEKRYSAYGYRNPRNPEKRKEKLTSVSYDDAKSFADWLRSEGFINIQIVELKGGKSPGRPCQHEYPERVPHSYKSWIACLKCGQEAFR
jgi:hypothetical protein